MPVFSAIAGGVLSAAGSIGGGVLGLDLSRKTAHEQIDFQREMSGTSYQRAVADMQAAGLNPMLAYQQGGASTPSGAQMNTAGAAQLGEGVSTGISSALAVTQAQKGQSETLATQASVPQITADTRLKNASAQSTEIQNAVMAKYLDEITAGQAKSSTSRGSSDWYKAEREGIEYRGGGEEKRGVAPVANMVVPNVFDRVAQDYARQQVEVQQRQFGLARERRAAELYGGPFGDQAIRMHELGNVGASALGVEQLGGQAADWFERHLGGPARDLGVSHREWLRKTFPGAYE